MFDWVLNTSPNVFSTINFSYQYLPEAKVYLEPSRTSTTELFPKFFFCCKIDKKTSVPESLFNKVTSLYPATSLDERTPTQVLSDEFCEILKKTFLQNTFRRLLPFYRKIFYQENRKEPSEKRKKWKQLVRKTTTCGKQKLYHYLHQVFFYLFTIQKFLYFSFLCFP